MLLVVNQLRKQYLRNKTPFYALNNVSFSLDKGESASIVGRSGSGKSTLLNIVAGLLSPTSGEVWFNNVNMFALSDNEISVLRNTSIGYIPQGTSLISTLDAMENVCLPYYLGGRRGSCFEKAQKLLAEVELDGMEHAYPSEMSGGEMLRVAIARALINSPELIVADEPTSDLDIETSHEIMELLAKINREGTAILLVTHHLEMTKYFESIYRLNSGILERTEIV